MELPAGWIIEEKRSEPIKPNLPGIELFDNIFDMKRADTRKVTPKKKEVRRKRGKLSKKEVAEFSKTNHNVFDWVKKERVIVGEKIRFEEIEERKK